jgi:two-component system, OmpR family, phosphate regulon sensor histidine kinase PhoR
MPQSRQRRLSPPRQAVLLVLAVVFPSLIIASLGVMLIRQEQELAERRSADRRRQIASEVRQELLAALSRIRSRELSRIAGEGSVAPSPAVVLSLPIRGGAVVPPWERSDEETEALRDAQAAAALEEGQRMETRRPREAEAAYRRAAASTDSLASSIAKFSLARVLARAGNQNDADRLDAATAALSFDIADEYGMPLAVYAAQRLRSRSLGLPREFLFESLDSMHTGRWPSPALCYALLEISQGAADSDDASLRGWSAEIAPLAAARAAEAERVLALQDEVPRIVPGLAGGDEPRWIMSGDPPWLVAAAGTRSGEMVLIAVDPLELVRSISVPGAADLRLVRGNETGEPLGATAPDTRVSFAAIDPDIERSRLTLQQSFYGAVLALVLGVAILGVFLLWRDMRREARLGALRTQFVASVSHELKTPLTSIRMFAETLRMRDELETRTQNECLDTIIAESERLTRLLNNVLDFSRIEQERKTYDFTTLDLRDVIRAAVRTVQYPLAEGGFDLQVGLDPTIPPVHADPDAMQQAILNLLTNAMKYSGTGRRIALSLAREGGEAVISVTDDGAGVADDDLPRLFDRFYRARTVANQHIPGAGLGLTIVQHIVQAHGGGVAAESTPGSGSTFRIRLPIPAQPVVESALAEAGS